MTYRISITVEKLDPELLESCLRHGRIFITWQGEEASSWVVKWPLVDKQKGGLPGRQITLVPRHRGKQKVYEVALQWLAAHKVGDLVDLGETGELASAIASHGYKVSNVYPVSTKLVHAGFIKRTERGQAIVIALPSKQESPS